MFTHHNLSDNVVLYIECYQVFYYNKEEAVVVSCTVEMTILEEVLVMEDNENSESENFS